MAQRASIAALLHDLDHRSPAGFAVALHIRFATPTFLFQTYPKRWMDQYSAAGLVIHDPTVRWALHNVGRVRWAELETADPEGVLERAKDFGIMNGVSMSVLLGGSRSIASFARADRDYEEFEAAALEEIFVRLHRETVGIGRLSARDRDALTKLSITLTR